MTHIVRTYIYNHVLVKKYHKWVNLRGTLVFVTVKLALE